MDLRWTPEQQKFRAEVHDWLAEKMKGAPESAKGGWFLHDEPGEEGYEFAKEIQQELVKKGWLAIAWPKEYGGAGFSIAEQLIFSEEESRLRVPRVYGTGGGSGNIIILHGTPEQKKKFLPKILYGELIIWTCFTEPDGGSDLANLKTRAQRDGDYYIVNGAKMFVGDSHPVDYMYIWARTNPDVPKHEGISAFFVDARAPGVEIRPMQSLAANRKNAVFFDNVRVPAGNLIGKENRGWYLAMSNLRDSDRSGAANLIPYQRAFEEFLEFCRKETYNGKPLIEDPLVEQQIGELATELHTMRLVALRNLWMQVENKNFTYEGSLSALIQRVFPPKFAAGLLEICQHGGTLKAGSPWATLDGMVEHLQRYALMTHTHGTPEIQKTMIARRGLGLPRGW